jgi:hypothetical protein
MNPLLRLASLIVIVLCFVLSILRADEQTTTHRIIGLFEPDRQEDLRECVKTMPEVEITSLDYDTAEITFRYDVTKLINGYNPKKPPTAEAITKRLDELLRAASNGTFTLQPPATIPKDKLESVAINVGILDCKGCRYAAYLAVAKLDGVERATITPETHTLSVWIDPARTKRTTLEDALKKVHIELAVP